MPDRKGLTELLDYEFKDEKLLDIALTHSSFASENDLNYRYNNERMEFIGDALLDAFIGCKLFEIMPDATEGGLSKCRAKVVCERSLASVAREISLGDYLQLGHGEELTGGRNKDSILSDALEALIGAVFLDGGYAASSRVTNRLLAENVSLAVKNRLFSDYKTELQERLQEKYKGIKIEYLPVSESGPDHRKEFTVSVRAMGKILGTGTGYSKKEAEQNAARDVLMKGEFQIVL